MAKKGKGKGKGGGGRHRPPQPPAPAPPPPPDYSQGGSYQYQPTAESQLNQPYQDVMAAGAMGVVPSMFNRYGQQGQLGDIYGGTAAGSLGQYGQLMGPNFQIQQSIANRIRAIQS